MTPKRSQSFHQRIRVAGDTLGEPVSSSARPALCHHVPSSNRDSLGGCRSAALQLGVASWTNDSKTRRQRQIIFKQMLGMATATGNHKAAPGCSIPSTTPSSAPGRDHEPGATRSRLDDVACWPAQRRRTDNPRPGATSSRRLPMIGASRGVQARTRDVLRDAPALHIDAPETGSRQSRRLSTVCLDRCPKLAYRNRLASATTVANFRPITLAVNPFAHDRPRFPDRMRVN